MLFHISIVVFFFSLMNFNDAFLEMWGECHLYARFVLFFPSHSLFLLIKNDISCSLRQYDNNLSSFTPRGSIHLHLSC